MTKGDSGLCAGGNCGISFGGSSIAENTVYINGLNVTDFYNRVGSSTVPYAFYKEFQVKTGGYSVEFGRTTGGVINAVTRSGTNEFEFGTEVGWEPSSLQSSKTTISIAMATPRIIGSYDEYDRTNATVYASGPIVKDRLFFFAMYEARDYQRVNTDDAANSFYDGEGGQRLLGREDRLADQRQAPARAAGVLRRERGGARQLRLRLSDRTSAARSGTRASPNSGGLNWSATYTGYLTDNFSMKALYGENEREFSPLQQQRRRMLPACATCARAAAATSAAPPARNVSGAHRHARGGARSISNGILGDHQVRFGMDHETQHFGARAVLSRAGSAAVRDLRRTTIRDLENGAVVPVGTEYVRTRSNEVNGEFETINPAFYLEDNWSITDSLVLNGGVRWEAFDNKNSDGDSYIKMDDMIAPRFGFSWDMKGDNRSKLFGNAGRYFLPVANVINIKQAGGFLDERTFYQFLGFEPFEYNGTTRQRPILGAQLGPVDNSQGDGTVGDLRGEVDQDMDPVYQDELILGFQSMIDDKWSWGVRGIYRKLNNAIDDMEITSNGIVCDGEPVGAGFVMGNPGEPLTIFTDTELRRRERRDASRSTLRRPAGRCSTRTATTSATCGYPEAEARLQGARVHDRPRVGRPLGVQCHVHAVVQRGQRRRPDQLGHRFRRHRPHRGVRQSVGELRRRRLPAERSPAPDQGARRLRARPRAGSSARR